MLPIVDRAFANGQRVDDPAFAEAYVAALVTDLGASLRSPRLQLQELAVVADSKLARTDGSYGPFVIRSLGLRNYSIWGYDHTCCGGDFLDKWQAHHEHARLAVVRVNQRSRATLALCNAEATERPGYSIASSTGARAL